MSPAPLASVLPLLAAEDPSSLLAARWQMALSLGWHIVLACFGVAFPLLIFVVHRRGLRDDDEVALGLAKRWSKVAAVLFAVGAVSGTILSFEMGMLWPELMRTYGDVIGLPFALEGIAFFIEAIFIGIYLYGWGRLPGRVHLMMLVPIAVSGLVGTFCILAVNGWMNSPAGFQMVDGQVTDVDPWAAMFNQAVWVQFAHMWVAAVMVVGFVTAAVYATGMLRGRDDRHHRLAFGVALAFAAAAAIVQPAIGHLAGARLADAQPTKLAAMEGAVTTERPAPLVIGGILVDGERRFAIEIPKLGSLLARASVDRPIQGLDAFAPEDRPRDALVNVVRFSFQGMVAIGTALAGFGLWWIWAGRRGTDLLASRRFLRLAVVTGPAAVLALQLGWITTEVGRQPWVVYGQMRVAEAVTRGSGVWVSLSVLVVVYAAMTVGSVITLRSMARRWREGDPLDLPTPYSPESVGRPPAEVGRP
ncbi:MAG: cytochrome ubiquinol oxidase subunit I [Acidimicrobiales bacterium]